jgi:hypothetical protein
MMMGHFPMLIIMFIAGILSSMSIWADKLSDMAISLNDIYMSLLMCGWMLFFMGLYEKNYQTVLIGLISVIIIFIMIRTQLFITPKQYLVGMIPHHSMAVLMSKKLLERGNLGSELNILAKNIINSQEKEIEIMKHL